jgi:hypothetical protein
MLHTTTARTKRHHKPCKDQGGYGSQCPLDHLQGFETKTSAMVRVKRTTTCRQTQQRGLPGVEEVAVFCPGGRGEGLTNGYYLPPLYTSAKTTVEQFGPARDGHNIRRATTTERGGVRLPGHYRKLLNFHRPKLTEEDFFHRLHLIFRRSLSDENYITSVGHRRKLRNFHRLIRADGS